MALQSVDFKEVDFSISRTNEPSNVTAKGVHLYYLDTLKVILPQDADRFISKEELYQAGRFAFAHLTHRYKVGRYVLRLLLGSRLSAQPEKLIFALDGYKKPFLPAHPDFFFNISYSKSKMVIGLSEKKIGVDIECIDPEFDFDTILGGFFSSEERSFIRRHSCPRTAFYLLWTRKEALLKGLGIGLVDDLSSISCLDGRRSIGIPKAHDDGVWVVHSMQGENITISVCGEQGAGDQIDLNIDEGFLENLLY